MPGIHECRGGERRGADATHEEARENVKRSVAKAVASLIALALLGAACGDDDDAATSPTTTAAARTSGNTASAPGITEDTITVGLVYTDTGVAAPNFKGLDRAFEARIAAENAKGGVNGRKIKVVKEDDTSSPNGNLTATQKVVQQGRPFVVVNNSAFTFGGYRYLLEQKVPMISGGYDGPQYADPGNEWLLPLSGNTGPNFPASTSTALAKFVKDQGVTKGGSLAYGVSPSSSAAAKNFATVALPAVALPKGYLNTSIPFGGENVGPVILDLKKAGIDGLYLPMDNNTNFAVVNAVEQNGLKMKAIVLATGYGQELLDQPTTLATAEKSPVFLQTAGIPVEANTPATRRFQSILKRYAGYDGVPGFQWFQGYGSAQLLIDGLKKAGQNPTREGFVDAVRSFDDYDVDGLTCSGVSFTRASYGKVDTTRELCSYYVKVQDGKFVIAEKTTGTLLQTGS